MSIQAKLKKNIHFLVLIIQKIILNIALFLVYFIGFGITLFFIWALNRKLFQDSDKKFDSYWREAIDYEPSEAELLRQS